jgi:hypothetical protein
MQEILEPYHKNSRMYRCKRNNCSKKKGSAPVNGDTVKHLGAVFNIPVCKVEHIKDAIFLYKL